MMKVFLSYSFAEDDRALASDVIALLESFEVRPVTGEVLGGGSLTTEVKALIDGSDALIALLTPREQLQSGRYTTSDWVRDELNYARTTSRRAIAVLDNRVDVGGAYQEHERVDYDPAAPARAILKLARVVARWKRETGRLVKVRILPETLARRAGANGNVVCQSRVIDGDKAQPWQPATVLPEVGGTFVYVRNAQDDALVQIELRLGNEVWRSPAAPQWMQTKLLKERVT